MERGNLLVMQIDKDEIDGLQARKHLDCQGRSDRLRAMIASFSRNFIFVKTQKVGGTSAEIVMSRWCSGADILTPISGEDEITRARFGSSPRNFAATSWDEPILRAVRRINRPVITDRIHRARKSAWRFYNHMPAHEIRVKLPELWEQAFKFTIERDPFEKIVSLAWWRARRLGPDAAHSLHYHIDRIISDRLYINYPTYAIDGRVAVDEVIPYDQLWKRLEVIANRLGCEIGDTPNAKGGYRKDRASAIDILSAEQKRQVLSDAAIEFDVLNQAATRQSSGSM